MSFGVIALFSIAVMTVILYYAIRPNIPGLVRVACLIVPSLLMAGVSQWVLHVRGGFLAGFFGAPIGLIISLVLNLKRFNNAEDGNTN
jgi:hypothetical protein